MLVNLSDLISRASGRWIEILFALAPGLHQAIAQFPRHVPCPVHGGIDGFRLFNDAQAKGGGVCNTCGHKASGFALIAWANGIAWYDAVCQVDQFLGGSSNRSVKARPPRPAITPLFGHRSELPNRGSDFYNASLHLPECNFAQWPGSLVNGFRRAYWMRLWNSAANVTLDPIKIIPPLQRNDPILTYLKSRGLASAPLSLWFQNVPYHDSNGNCSLLPAMLALYSRDDFITGMHMTFLRNDFMGKADVELPKKMVKFGESLSGSAIQLIPQPDPACDTLVIGEGIETVLAVHELSPGLASAFWACGSAALLRNVFVPQRFKRVIIAADLDLSGAGVTAAEYLAIKLTTEGRNVSVVSPCTRIPEGAKGVDWLDILNHEKRQRLELHHACN